MPSIRHGGHGRAVDAPLTRVGPGRWTARAALADEDFLVARVRDAAGALVGEAVAQDDAVNELATLGADERALRAIASEGGGEYGIEAPLAVRSGGTRGTRTVSVAPWLYLVAALFVVADVWLRRRDKRVRAEASARVVAPSLASIDGTRRERGAEPGCLAQDARALDQLSHAERGRRRRWSSGGPSR